MKRLLFFLLLIAISGCSNNLSYKTKEGKKNFIREDTVQLQKLTRDDFKEKYEKFIADKSKSFQSEITSKKNSVIYLKSKIKEGKKDDVIWFVYEVNIEKYKKRLAIKNNELVKATDDFNKWQKIYIPLIGSLKKDLQGTPKIHANNISFTAIETDLLNKKEILPRYQNYVCFNPKLTKRFRTDWKSKLGVVNLAQDNICKKFAKF